MKILIHIIAIAVLAFGWKTHIANKQSVNETRELLKRIDNEAISSDKIPQMLADTKNSAQKKIIEKLAEKLKGKETDVDQTMIIAEEMANETDGSSTFTGILLTFLSAGYVGIVFVAYVLPVIAHRATHTIYDSGEIMEKDPMAEARSKVAQGDYDGAILAFREAAEKDPGNRVPWVEIVKLQRETLHQPAEAIATIREALEQHEWQENDAAYLLFRLAELYDGDLADRDSAIEIMRQAMEQFPETRHSANARHKLHEWGVV
jgi:tetratricopeptide (TPR) repeat protein